MRKISPLVKRELAVFFNSPIAYVLGAGFIVFMSLWFFFLLRFPARNIASLRGYFEILPYVFIILIPALTMRGWAEERKIGTAELLLTLPYGEAQLVAAKFLGPFFFLLILLALTLPLPLTVLPLGNFETGEIIGEYLGIILLGAAALSVGQFTSALSTNQASAFLLGAGFLLFFTLIHFAASLALPDFIAGFLRYISLEAHFESFRKGVIDSRDLVYFLAMTFGFQYLSVKVLVFRKWS
ncbi:MAG: ABC transporter permease [Spirochaetales bacterium]|jgi:ABC-2 type transport system permease protein|nr:ABC transporter permease [Spirochaetales bacterium]